MEAPRIAPEQALNACRRLIGSDALSVEYPGGASRRSVRVLAAGSSFVATRRERSSRADLEAGVLRELRARGAPVPAVLAYDGEWLIQEDLGSRRLSSALGMPDPRVVTEHATQAATGLLLCQRAALQCGLASRVTPIGVTRDWCDRLLATPARVARRLDLPDPGIDRCVVPEQLLPRRLAFIKWDARPGNALIAHDGGVAWIDWEHCGARDALDDLAWLMCDEYMPDDADLEARLLDRFLPMFALQAGRPIDEARVYLSRMGCLHTCVRLFLVLRHKGHGGWWDAAACERTDRVSVTAAAARRLCARGARWAERWSGGERMRRFFIEAQRRLSALPQPDQRQDMAAAQSGAALTRTEMQQ